MCGIAGFVGNFRRDLLTLMGNSLQHRGPDNIDAFYQPKYKVGFVHTRLSIIDLTEEANQPMISSCGKITIVFNGEIYNFQSLKNKLIKKGYHFKTQGDTEVLLNLYKNRGINFLGELNGIFSIALHDQTLNKTFIARDGQGIKPLYYSNTSRGFIFASELKALLCDSSVERELDPKAISNYLTYLWAPTPLTMLKGIKKLESGNCLVVQNSKIIKRFCYYDYPIGKNDISFSKKTAINETKKYLEKAVKSQLISDVPIGAFLSGGLDSSSIVAMAKKINPDMNLPCFTIDFKDQNIKNEGMTLDLPYAKRAADHLGVDLNIVTVGSEMICDLEKMIYHLDEPQADLAPLNAMYICELANSHGIKVLLSGAGGDDIFTGYRRHFALTKECYWSWLPSNARTALKKITSNLPTKYPLSRRINKAFQYADLNNNQRLISYFYWLDPNLSIGLLDNAFEDELIDYSPEETMLNSLKRHPPGASELSKMLYLEQKHFLADHNLNYTDKVSMAHGIEVRVPFLDKNLINFAASLPDRYKQNGGIGKWILKKAMEDYLPKDIIYRPKTGFGTPLRYWMNNDLKDLIDDVLSNDSIRKRGIFNPNSVKNLIEYDRKGLADYSYPILSLVSLEIWCRIFLDKRIPSL